MGHPWVSPIYDADSGQPSHSHKRLSIKDHWRLLFGVRVCVVLFLSFGWSLETHILEKSILAILVWRYLGETLGYRGFSMGKPGPLKD